MRKGLETVPRLPPTLPHDFVRKRGGWTIFQLGSERTAYSSLSPIRGLCWHRQAEHSVRLSFLPGMNARGFQKGTCMKIWKALT